MRLRTVALAATAATALAVPTATAATAASTTAHYRSHSGVLLNDLRATPGDVLSTVTTTICRSGYTATVRHVTAGQRRVVLTAYGVPAGSFELDHLIPLELGGSNATKNLWPEPGAGKGFGLKDRTENRLHSLVCAGSLGLRTAQQAMARDWYAACLRYVSGCAPTATPPPPSSSVYYSNCDAVRAAGKAPLHRGQPGYRSGLDRDGDGVACE